MNTLSRLCKMVVIFTDIKIKHATWRGNYRWKMGIRSRRYYRELHKYIRNSLYHKNKRKITIQNRTPFFMCDFSECNVSLTRVGVKIWLELLPSKKCSNILEYMGICMRILQFLYMHSPKRHRSPGILFLHT